MSELFVVSTEKDIGVMGKGRNTGMGGEWGVCPLVMLNFLEMPQGPSLGRCCRSPCFFLRGFRAFCRTKEHRVGVCGMETRTDPGGSSTMSPLP